MTIDQTQLISVSNDILSTLRHFTFTGNLLKAPNKEAHTIPDGEFQALNRFVSNYPCKWNRSKQAFEFDFDTTSFFEPVIQTGMAPKPNKYAYHPTPAHALEKSFLTAEIDQSTLSYRRVLDPHGGQGAMLDYARSLCPDNSEFHTCEIDPINRATLQYKGYDIACDDFMAFEPEIDYQVILCNPPYSINNRSVWLSHVKHALSMLSDYGVLMAIIPQKQFFSDEEPYASFREQCFQQPFFKMEFLPKGTFTTAKGIETVSISLQGDKAIDHDEKYLEYDNWFMMQAGLTIKNDGEVREKIKNISIAPTIRKVDALTDEVYKILFDVQVYLPRSMRIDVSALITSFFETKSKGSSTKSKPLISESLLRPLGREQLTLIKNDEHKVAALKPKKADKTSPQHNV